MLGYVYEKLRDLAIKVNFISGVQKINYEEIKPIIWALKKVIEQLKVECKDFSEVIKELKDLETILVNEELKRKEARMKNVEIEPGE